MWKKVAGKEEVKIRDRRDMRGIHEGKAVKGMEGKINEVNYSEIKEKEVQ